MGSTAVLRCDAPGQFGDAASAGTVYVGPLATLRISPGVDETIGSLQLSGHVILDDASSAIRIGLHDGDAGFGGVISGPGAVIMEGTGTQTLSGSNTYTGPTGVSNGTLMIRGSQPASSVFTMAPGTVALAGGGSVGLVLTASGTTLGLGAGGGASKSLTHLGILDVYLGGLLASERGSLSVVGTVSLDDTSSRLTGVTGSAFTPSAGTVFTIIANDGSDAVSGHFADLPEGATAQIGDWLFVVSYVGGDGNDVTLSTLGPAPHPAGGLTKPWYRLNPIQAGRRCGHGSGGAVALLLPALLLAWRRGRRPGEG